VTTRSRSRAVGGGHKAHPRSRGPEKFQLYAAAIAGGHHRGYPRADLARTHRLAVRPWPDQRRAFHPGPTRRPRHRADQPPVPTVNRRQPARPGNPRRDDQPISPGCINRVLLGGAGPRGPLAPRQLVNQLDLSHVRPAPVRRPDKATNLDHSC